MPEKDKPVLTPAQARAKAGPKKPAAKRKAKARPIGTKAGLKADAASADGWTKADPATVVQEMAARAQEGNPWDPQPAPVDKEWREKLQKTVDSTKAEIRRGKVTKDKVAPADESATPGRRGREPEPIPTTIEEVRKKMMGRPTDFKQETADIICELLIGGMSLRAICNLDEMPAKSTVLKWLMKYPDFQTQYALARQEQAEGDVDEMKEIADDEELDPNDKKVRIETRKWLAMKMKPKKYGDKLDLNVEGNLNLSSKTDDEVRAMALALAAKAGIAAAKPVTADGDTMGSDSE